MILVKKVDLYVLQTQHKCPLCDHYWEAAISDIDVASTFIEDLKHAPSSDRLSKNNDPDMIKIQQYEGLPVANILCSHCNDFHWSEQVWTSAISETIVEWQKTSIT